MNRTSWLHGSVKQHCSVGRTGPERQAERDPKWNVGRSMDNIDAAASRPVEMWRRITPRRGNPLLVATIWSQ